MLRDSIEEKQKNQENDWKQKKLKQWGPYLIKKNNKIKNQGWNQK